MVSRLSLPVRILHKLTDSSSQTILCSGGGFSLPARPDYFRFLHALKKDVSTSFGDIGVVALEYCESHQSLEPTAPQIF